MSRLHTFLAFACNIVVCTPRGTLMSVIRYWPYIPAPDSVSVLEPSVNQAISCLDVSLD